MKSKPPAPTSGSRVSAQNARTFDSMAAIFLGVKTRDNRPRCTSWIGGSSARMFPGGISTLARMNSSVDPRPER
jgi:hypothetical protein